MSQSKSQTAPLPGSGVTQKRGKAGALGAAGVTGVLASVCCVGPLVAVSLGVGGALVAGMVAFEPYRPAFIAMALLALGYAGWQIYRSPAAAAESDAFCALPRADRTYKIGFWLVAALAAASIGSPYLAPFFY